MKVRDLFLQAAQETALRTSAEITVINEKPLLIRFAYPDGTQFHTRGTLAPLNTRVVGELLSDKMLTVKMQQADEIPGPDSLILSARIQDAMQKDAKKARAVRRDIKKFIRQAGSYPVFMKPNSGSKGRGVFGLDSHEDLDAALKRALQGKRENQLVQQACEGDEYRLVVLNGVIELGILKRPLDIVGDGIHSIRWLIKKRLSELKEQGRNVKIKADSPKILSHLTKQGLGLRHVLPPKQQVFVLANKNLSDGGSAVTCTEEAIEKFGDLCAKIHTKTNARWFGVDVIDDIRWSKKPQPKVIEINGKPGLNHYIQSGKQEQDLVRRLFVKAIEAAYQQHRSLRPSAVFLPEMEMAL